LADNPIKHGTTLQVSSAESEAAKVYPFSGVTPGSAGGDPLQ
jgi:hypothetical protein